MRLALRRSRRFDLGGQPETGDAAQNLAPGAPGRKSRGAPAARATLLATLSLACGASAGGAPGSSYPAPARPEQAPFVTVREIVESDTLVGRRVRVAGTCALAGTGPSTGAWVLQSDGFTVEVRGLVPRSCFRNLRNPLTIFAQVEPKAPRSAERLLLRLPE